jgi:MarR family transcriptional repressor of emrRAB
MNNIKRVSYADKRLRVERAHRLADPEGLANIRLSMIVKHNSWLIADWMTRQLEQQGLAFSSYVTLVSLYGLPEGQANPSELCLCTGETRANMTRICDELVARGLMDRVTSLEDRRRVDLTLTDKGRVLLEAVMPDLRGRLSQLLSVFSEDEKGQLENLLLKLMRTFEADL